MKTICFASNAEYGQLFADGCVMALGFFDGVHLAHRHLLSVAKEAARRHGLPLAVFTFSGDSGIKSSSPRLYQDSDRLSLLAECSVDIAVVADFGAVSGITREDFITDVLIGKFNTRVAVSGYNFAFGKGALGNVGYLSETLFLHGRECIVIDEFTALGERISTTRIKELIAAHDMEGAARLLGTPYFIGGEVEHGRGAGKGLGIPTVNTPLTDTGGMLGYGVYASVIVSDGKRYRALTNVGECPTFGARRAHAETFILDFDGDLYGQSVRIYLLSYLREEREFSTPDALLQQIKLDTDKALSLNLEGLWQETGLN